MSLEHHSAIPAEPTMSDEQRKSGTVELRYEDVSQDGRVVLAAMPPAIGVIWRELAQGHVTKGMRQTGTVPLLTRLVIEGGSGPVSVRDPIEVRGGYQLAHTLRNDGAVERLVLLMWVVLMGRRGLTHGPAPERAGEPVLVGRVFAEHVFTRPFAPPGERKVLRFDIAGLPEVPPDRYEWKPPEELAALPDDAVALDDEAVPDPAPVIFGLDHTDSNQHVNSLAYPRLFVEASLRRLAAHGQPTRVIARLAELTYRKPCFAGDRMSFRLRAFEQGGALGAAGALWPEHGAQRAHCYARVILG